MPNPLLAPNIFKEDSSRNLPRIFPPDQGNSTFNLPKVLGSTVQLVHDYLSTLPYVAVSITDVIGANDVLSIIMATGIPDGYIFIIESLGLWTDDATAREYTVWVHYINALGDFGIPVQNISSTAVAGRWTAAQLPRVILPPAAKLEVTVPALTAGKHLRFTMAGLQIPAGQFAPRS
jgi:hypothetical protein